MRGRIVPILIILLVLAALSARQIFFLVVETEQAIILQFGEPVRTIVDPGLARKVPVIQNVIFFEKRILSSDAEPQEYLTADKKRLVIDHVTRWRIDRPLDFFKAVRTETGARARLDDIVFSELREELAKVLFKDVISAEREAIMERVTVTAGQKAEAFGIVVEDVRIKRADLPSEVEQSIFERMRAERQRESSLFRAEGEEQANIIRAQADRASTVILAEGYQEAQVLRGDGQAEAIRIYAAALEQDREFYAFSRRLEAYALALKQGDRIVIPTDADFFRYLTDPSAPQPDSTADSESSEEQ